MSSPNDPRQYARILAHIERHNIRKWLLDGCSREEAHTIARHVKRLSDGQLARRFARILTK